MKASALCYDFFSGLEYSDEVGEESEGFTVVVMTYKRLNYLHGMVEIFEGASSLKAVSEFGG